MTRRWQCWLEAAWNAPPGPPPPLAWILDPLSHLYGLALAARRTRTSASPIPIVSVGSIRVGGAGKTPLASEIARILTEMGEAPAIVLRGYGGRFAGPAVEVAPSASDPDLHGDEACLHALRGIGRVVVARKRIDGVRMAHAAGCTAAILDDGMQHRSIARDLEIVTLPESAPLANGRLLPRGPLREPPEALGRAELIVLSHAGSEEDRKRGITDIACHLTPGTPILAWGAKLEIRGMAGPIRPGARVGLLCGIARPDSFRRAVEEAGFEIAWVKSFPDHHRFTHAEIDGASRRASSDRLDAVLTTEKDAARMGTEAQRKLHRCAVARIELVWAGPDDETRLRGRLREALARSVR